MAKRNQLAVVAEGETVLEGEVLSPENGQPEAEDFTAYHKDIKDSIPAVRKMVVAVAAHTKEGRRLLFITASSIVCAALTHGEEAMELVPEFFKALGDDRKNAYRTNIFRDFFERVGPMVWDTERMVRKGDKEVKEPGLVLHAKKRATLNRKRQADKAAFDTALMTAAPWQLAPKEAQYQPVDVPSALKALVKRARRATDPDYITKTSATDEQMAENNLELLDDIEKLLKKHGRAHPAQVSEGSEARN